MPRPFHCCHSKDSVLLNVSPHCWELKWQRAVELSTQLTFGRRGTSSVGCTGVLTVAPIKALTVTLCFAIQYPTTVARSKLEAGLWLYILLSPAARPCQYSFSESVYQPHCSHWPHQPHLDGQVHYEEVKLIVGKVETYNQMTHVIRICARNSHDPDTLENHYWSPTDWLDNFEHLYNIHNTHNNTQYPNVYYRILSANSNS